MSQVTGKLREGEEANSRVHFSKGANNDLEEHFRKALDPNTKQPRPLETRNLPPSFFIQPDPGSEQAVPITHTRSRSSPALMTSQPLHTLPVPHHIRQNSAHLLAGNSSSVQPQYKAISKGLPNNLGQKLFINPSGEQPAGTWAGDCGDLGGVTPAAQQPQPQPQTLSPTQPRKLPPAASLQTLGALPQGWEQGVTPDGEIYFINHADRTTSWLDPRIPKNIPRPDPTKLAQVSTYGQASAQLPEKQPPAQQPTNRGHISLPNTQFLMIHSELIKLQQEKARLQKQQDDVAKKELLLKYLMSPMAASSVPSQDSGGLQLSPSASSVDPFLGQASNTSHVRQSSGDSGLIGSGYSLPCTPDDLLMGNVAHMDTQDSTPKQSNLGSSDFTMNDVQASSVSTGMGNLDMNDLQASRISTALDNLDMNGPSSGMDSDDLVPSLREDISSLSRELLQDVDVQKIDNLLWL